MASEKQTDISQFYAFKRQCIACREWFYTDFKAEFQLCNDCITKRKGKKKNDGKDMAK